VQFLQSLAAAPLDDWPAVEARVERTAIEPGQVLFRAGEVHPSVYLLLNGVVKLSVPRLQGEPALVGLARAGDLVASLHALLPQGLSERYHADVRTIAVSAGAGFDPSDQTATAVTGGTVERVDFAVLVEAMLQHTVWGVAIFRALALHTLAREHRAQDLLILSAEDRYRTFLTALPELVGVLPQKDIASYIGVTPVGLSRIAGRVRAERRSDPADTA